VPFSPLFPPSGDASRGRSRAKEKFRMSEKGEVRRRARTSSPSPPPSSTLARARRYPWTNGARYCLQTFHLLARFHRKSALISERCVCRPHPLRRDEERVSLAQAKTRSIIPKVVALGFDGCAVRGEENGDVRMSSLCGKNAVNTFRAREMCVSVHIWERLFSPHFSLSLFWAVHL